MIEKAKFLLFPLLLCFGTLVRATNSDSLDVLHYGIHIDTIQNTTTLKKIVAHTDVEVRSTVSTLSTITLDLLRFTVDSVKVDGQSATFSYNDTLLAIHPAVAPGMGDSVTVRVWYQGRGGTDAGGFGGLYFVTNNVFNLGVGLTTDPHVFGRAWFPCKDNFVDRAHYDFYFRVDSSFSAIANGDLQSVSPSGGASRTWHWQLEEAIPTYLAGFSVAPYVHVDRDYVSVSGDTIPYDIYALASDTNAAKNQAQRLLTGVAAFEEHFGAFTWQRLGYVIVNQPTSGSIGAMEHPTNIAYPKVLVNQGTVYETIWAHEASHHWFGDLVTCEREEEMWLNEGWASYCEALFMEAAYSFDAYKAYNRSVHADVLRRAHVDDGGYWPLSAVPHSETYGRTVYSKGAMVAHTLRGQLRDARFFPAITDYLDYYRLRHVNSDSMSQRIEATTGRSMQNFFDVFVHQSGFTHVSLDSFYHIPGGLDHYFLFLRQRLKGGATTYADSLVVPVRIICTDWSMIDTTVVVTGPTDSIHIGGLGVPVAVIIDPDEWIADATTDMYQTIRSIGTKAYANCYFDALVDTLPDSAWVQVTHHWISPDSFWSPRSGIKLSNSRYWTVAGLLPQGFHAQGKFYYNGSTGVTSGLLDHTWMTNGEDSLILFYRPDAGSDWQEVAGYSRNMGSPADKIGNVQAHDLQVGEYALGTYENFVTARNEEMAMGLRVYPNPNDGRFHLDFPSPNGRYELRLIDMEGRTISELVVENQSSVLLEKGYLANGTYLLMVRDASGRVGTERIVIER